MSPSWTCDLGMKLSPGQRHILPMDYGFTVRFRDYRELLVYQPRMLEFHFTDQDLDEHYPGETSLKASTRSSWSCMPRVLGPHPGRPVRSG